jgi:PAS domain S-box-containing protein
MSASLPGGGSGDPAGTDALHFRRLADLSPAILWTTSPEGLCTFLSRRWCEITGRPAESGLGSGWLDAVHPEDRAHAAAVFRDALARREPYGIDFRLRGADDACTWVLAAARPCFDDEGAFTGFAGTMFDITDRKRAEIALRRTEQTARFLANASVALAGIAESRAVLRKVASLAVPLFADWCAVDVVHDDGALERLSVVHSDPNKARLVHEIARTLLPHERLAAARVVRTGQPELAEQVPPLDQWIGDEDLRRRLQEVGLASYLCVPVRVRGRTVATLTFVLGAAERLYGPGDLRVAEDLAYRTSIAMENAELYHTALEADRRKDEFLATLSHELRTPLNAIVGWAHILRDTAADAQTVRKAADTIFRSAQLQTQLISDILDVSSITAGKLRLDVRPVQLHAVIEAALDTVRPAAAGRGVNLEAVLDPGAGPVSGDADRLQQVMWNLLSNAIKFAPAKTGRVHVLLEAFNSHVRMTVEDNGPGIAEEFLPHVFERFRQADSSSSRSHQGLGLGLAIVKHLVELHGGTVRVRNRTGQPGAVFIVDLPRRSVTEASPAVVVERHPRAEEPLWLESAPSLQGVQVLVIDDHEDARELIKVVLERCGASVETAATVADALAAVRARRPHVVLADIEMPEENGYDFIRRLRACTPELGGLTPTVALTAYATAQDRVNALRAGFQMHVTKPVQPAELVAVVFSLARRGTV